MVAYRFFFCTILYYKQEEVHFRGVSANNARSSFHISFFFSISDCVNMYINMSPSLPRTTCIPTSTIDYIAF